MEQAKAETDLAVLPVAVEPQSAPVVTNTSKGEPAQEPVVKMEPAAAAVPVATPSNVTVPPPGPETTDLPDRGSQHHPVAEFLYQLTKMLTDENSEIIEWVEGRIKVHHPERLESEVLHKYFRHSKFASFQRQLNYFGFRKIAGKGKMSPCSYVNENATSDIRSLLHIKRKTNGSAARKAAMQQRAAMSLSHGMNPALGTGLPGLAPGFAGAFTQFQMQQNPLSHLLVQNQQRQSWNDLQQLGGLKPNMPSIEQLQAQLATLSKQQNQVGANATLNAAALNFANGGGPNTAQLQPMDNPATAAMNAAVSSMPATAAMNAASAAAGQATNLFDSATNLKSLLGNEQNGTDSQKAAQLQGQMMVPNGMFPSNPSLGNLLGSNRLSSLLSLNSFLSRDPSMADFGGQLAALQQQNQQGMTRSSNNQQGTMPP